jgi:hypothetical protein
MIACHVCFLLSAIFCVDWGKHNVDSAIQDVYLAAGNKKRQVSHFAAKGSKVRYTCQFLFDSILSVLSA